MNSILYQGFDEYTINQIDTLARTTGKPKEMVLRDVVKTGLKYYQTVPIVSFHSRRNTSQSSSFAKSGLEPRVCSSREPLRKFGSG